VTVLSDSIRVMRKSKEAEGDKDGEVLILKAFEAEAVNMEERLLMLTGRPHAPLDGNLISRPDAEGAQP
jgi:hypothetical protein